MTESMLIDVVLVGDRAYHIEYHGYSGEIRLMRGGFLIAVFKAKK